MTIFQAMISLVKKDKYISVKNERKISVKN
jgi:hypothetical protein